MTTRYLNLDVKDRGAWRRVTVFARDVLSLDALQQASHALLQLSAYPGLQARLIETGETAPVAVWDADRGWRPWRSPATPVQRQFERRPRWRLRSELMPLGVRSKRQFDVLHSR